MWKVIKCKTLGKYHDYYLASDVLLLSDVFEKFREKSVGYYELDPAYYFTTPGLSWKAMLKKTNVSLELMSDVDMYQFIKRSLRSGVCT